jgi:predicted component of type VI protein secretion system
MYTKKRIGPSTVPCGTPEVTCIFSDFSPSNMTFEFESNNILYDLQHGFRSSKSCETQLTSFIQELAKNNNDKIQTDVIVMDFAKAFDKDPHKRLL